MHFPVVPPGDGRRATLTCQPHQTLSKGGRPEQVLGVESGFVFSFRA